MAVIPLVDLGDTERVVKKIDAAFRDVGFLYLTGHGISPDLIEAVRESVVDYFSQSLECKLRDRITRDNYRGYIPLGFFSPNAGATDVDSYEGYKLHRETPPDDLICRACDLYGPNRWPQTTPKLKEAITAYWRECDRVTHLLLKYVAEILSVPTSELLENFESPLTNMTLLHYPPQAADAAGFGIHPHKDTDALTLLAPDPIGGLMVRRRDADEWIVADPPDGALVVNIGDLLELWSGGYFVSTPHKVVNTSGAERYSFPYFAVPRFDTVVAPLIERQDGFDRASVHVGDVSAEVWRTNWPDAEPAETGFDLGTLEN